LVWVELYFGKLSVKARFEEILGTC
jgi:hypothetical protein